MCFHSSSDPSIPLVVKRFLHQLISYCTKISIHIGDIARAQTWGIREGKSQIANAVVFKEWEVESHSLCYLDGLCVLEISFGEEKGDGDLDRLVSG